MNYKLVITESTHIINNTYRGQQKSLNHTTKICEPQIKFCSVLCNVRSKALNVCSKALNGLFIVVQEQHHNKQETISMLLK